MTIKIRADGLWAGSQESYEKWAAIDAAIDEKLLSGGFGQDQQDTEDDLPDLLDIQGGVGVISIKGPLTNRDSWMNSVMGVVSYGQIREALVYAAESPDVTQILLYIDSGGGSVSGCLDTSNLIAMVNDKIKPVTAFADGMMCSAAYWLGCSAGEVYGSQTADIGSIGVIAIHMERSKMLKEMGIGATVVRSGEFKALANGVEPLSDVAKAQIQSQLDAAYKVFVTHVAADRNVPYDYCDANMANGKEFFGQQALDAGLVDGITSYDALMQELLNKSIDTSKKSMNNRSNTPPGGDMKRTLNTEQLLAAAAEGGVAAAAGVAPDAAVIAAQAEEDAAAALAAKSELDAAAAAAAALAAKEVTADTGVVAMLQAQLKEANASLMQANLDAFALKSQYDAMKASHDGLVLIAKKSVGNMRVALGGSAVDLSAMSAEFVLAEHQSLSAQFASTFKVGGVAAVDAATKTPTKPSVDPRHMARVNAALGTK